MHEVDCDSCCLFELCKSLVLLLKGLSEGSVPPLGDLGGLCNKCEVVAFAK